MNRTAAEKAVIDAAMRWVAPDLPGSRYEAPAKRFLGDYLAWCCQELLIARREARRSERSKRRGK